MSKLRVYGLDGRWQDQPGKPNSGHKSKTLMINWMQGDQVDWYKALWEKSPKTKAEFFHKAPLIHSQSAFVYLK